MSRFAIPALILVHCDSHRGEWVALDTLIARIVAPRHIVQDAADHLVATHQLLMATRAGQPVYGVGVEGVQP